MKNLEGSRAYVGSSDQHESIEKKQGVRRKKRANQFLGSGTNINFSKYYLKERRMN